LHTVSNIRSFRDEVWHCVTGNYLFKTWSYARNSFG
jgi:hypothetical protein